MDAHVRGGEGDLCRSFDELALARDMHHVGSVVAERSSHNACDVRHGLYEDSHMTRLVHPTSPSPAPVGRGRPALGEDEATYVANRPLGRHQISLPTFPSPLQSHFLMHPMPSNHSVYNVSVFAPASQQHSPSPSASHSRAFAKENIPRHLPHNLYPSPPSQQQHPWPSMHSFSSQLLAPSLPSSQPSYPLIPLSDSAALTYQPPLNTMANSRRLITKKPRPPNNSHHDPIQRPTVYRPHTSATHTHNIPANHPWCNPTLLTASQPNFNFPTSQQLPLADMQPTQLLHPIMHSPASSVVQPLPTSHVTFPPIHSPLSDRLHNAPTRGVHSHAFSNNNFTANVPQQQLSAITTSTPQPQPQIMISNPLKAHTPSPPPFLHPTHQPNNTALLPPPPFRAPPLSPSPTPLSPTPPSPSPILYPRFPSPPPPLSPSPSTNTPPARTTSPRPSSRSRPSTPPSPRSPKRPSVKRPVITPPHSKRRPRHSPPNMSLCPNSPPSDRVGTSEGNRLVSGAGESLGSPTQAMANLQPMGGPPVAGLRSHGTFRLRIRQANRANSQPESVIRSLPMGRRLPHSMNMPSGACSTVTECTQPSDPSTNGAIAPEDAAGRVAPGGRRTCASDVRIVLPPKKKGRHAEAAGTANAPDQAQGRGSILLKLPLRARGDGAEPSGRPAASKRPSRKRRQIAPAKPKAKRQRMPAKGEASRAAPCKAPRLDAVSAEEGGSEISPQGGKQEKKTRQPRGKAVKSRAASAKEARNPEVSSLEVRGRENVAKRGRVARLPPKKALEKPSRSKATSSTRLRLALRASSKMDGSGDAAEKASGSKAPVENKEPVEASAPPAAPCFAKEVENLSTREACDASARGMGGLQTTVTCGVCHEDTVNGLKHPFFPLVGLDICRGCENSLLFDRGPGRKDSSPSSAQRIIHRTTLMVVLIEDIIQTMTPSERSRRGVDMVYKCVSSRSQDDMVERAESLPVPYEMLTVLRVALRKIGLTIRAGRVVWPTSTIQLPSAEDSHALVLSSIPRSFADLRSNNTGAERVWKAVFGEELQGVKSSYDIYQKLLGLLGIKLSHLDDSETCENRSQGCKVQLDKVSIDAAMYRTAAMVSGTVMRAVLGECWGEQEVLRYMEANDTRLAFEQSLSGNHGEVCSICVTPYDESGFPFRYVECTDCKRKFCSVCLSNVCGASEYARGIGEEAYCCMLCRVRRHGKEQWIDNEVHGGRKRHGPFLRLSSEMKKTVTGGSKGDEVKRIEDIRFAKFCEVSNEECVAGKLRANGRNVSFERIGDELCIGCKQTAITGGQDIHLEDSIGVLCNAEKCTNVMHKKCCEVPKEQQTRRRGSRTRWTCPQHQCGKCDQRDEGKILRCRTCPRAYCRDHLPSPCEIHLFSDRYMACPDCAPKVMGPTESAGGRMTEAARRRNYMTGGSMVGVGQRKCCVKRLEEVDVECCNISFEQFQREMEDKMER